MFRKIVSNLSFSPSLITQVGFYASRLRKEEITRRLTVIFVALGLVVECLIVFSPPESANASSEQDLIRGGISSLDDLLVRYDKNTDDIKDIYTLLGLTRDELTQAKPATINSKDSIYSVHRLSQYSAEQGETRFVYQSSNGTTGARYISPLNLADTATTKEQSGTLYNGWVGQSSKLGWFAILKANASIATKGYPATVTADSSTLSLPVTRSLSVVNIQQGTDATKAPVAGFTTLAYTLEIKNNGATPIRLPLTISISDALQYSTVADAGAAIFDPTHKSLSWGTVTVPAGATEKRTFAMHVTSPIPSTPTGVGDANSYDCVIATSFGNTTRVGLECPPAKVTEALVAALPPVGPTLGLGLTIGVFAGAVYFYLRTKQLKKEIRLIRHTINTGAI